MMQKDTYFSVDACNISVVRQILLVNQFDYHRDLLPAKNNTLIQEDSSSKSDIKELYQIRNNYEKYIGKKLEK